MLLLVIMVKGGDRGGTAFQSCGWQTHLFVVHGKEMRNIAFIILISGPMAVKDPWPLTAPR